MEVKIKARDSFTKRVEKLIATGVPERQAVDAIKRIDSEMKHDPKKYIQPYIKAPNGEVIKNKEFYDIYGDPDKPYQNVGSGDYRDKLENDKTMEDMLKFKLGKFKSYS
jgi:hypothetical protein